MALDHAQYEAQVDDYFAKLNYWDFEQVHCTFCGPHASSYLLFRKGTMSIERCECGFVYSATQPKQSTLDQFYSKSTPMSTWSTIKESPREERRQREKFGEAIEFLKSMSTMSVLDIGCGNGRFLHMAKDAMPNVEVLGVDQNEDALNVAKLLGIPTHNQSLFDFLNDDKRTFEAVTLWGVLEHVKDPLWTLRRVVKKLHGDSLVIVCVPNVESLVVRTLWEKCSTFCPQHLWYFSAETIDSAFQCVGLKLVKHYTIEPESVPITKSLNGFHPYRPVPDWAEMRYLDEGFIRNHNEMIIKQGLGYKVVAIGQL